MAKARNAWLLQGSIITLLTLVLLYIGLSLFFYALGNGWELQSFRSMAGARMLPSFADLRWITATGECGVNLHDLYQKKVEACDHWGRPGLYPPMSIWITRILNVKASLTGWLGLAFGMLFVVGLLASLRRVFTRPWTWALVSCIFLISLPSQLGLERSNLDLLIYLTLLITAWFLSIAGNVAILASAIVALLSISLKIYPFFGILGWLLMQPSKQLQSNGNFHIRWSVVAIASVLGLLLSVPWVLHAGTPSASGGLLSHGLKAFGYINLTMIDTFGIDSARWLIRLAVFFKFAALAISVYISMRLGLASILEKYSLSNNQIFSTVFNFNLFIIMSATWIGCYILSINYDYRLIFMMPSLAFFIAAIEQSKHQLKRREQLLIWVLILSGLLAILLPLILLNLSGFTALKFFAEMSIEFLWLPIYAGALASVLFSNSIFSPFTQVILRQTVLKESRHRIS